MDKNYWKNVYKSREEIFNLVMDHNVFGLKSFGSISPIYGQIIDNGGIGLEFYYDIPQRLYTPLGFLKITDSTSLTVQNAITIRKILTNDYGISLVLDEEYTFYGKFGPVFSITKLPWSNESLPIFKLKERKDYTSSPIPDEIYRLCKETL